MMTLEEQERLATSKGDEHTAALLRAVVDLRALVEEYINDAEMEVDSLQDGADALVEKLQFELKLAGEPLYNLL